MMVTRPRGTDIAQVIQVIETRSIIGVGTETDPCRLIKQYWDFDGQLLAKKDEFIDGQPEDEK